MEENVNKSNTQHLNSIDFGAAVVGKSISPFSWEVVLYAILSLTLVRMAPVFLVLTGMNLRLEEKLFMGWFGPRGLARIKDSNSGIVGKGR
jgi:NhaP-type Na+/H+ or K+/H+ antiporter